jgi:hypothetical protein
MTCSKGFEKCKYTYVHSAIGIAMREREREGEREREREREVFHLTTLSLVKII